MYVNYSEPALDDINSIGCVIMASGASRRFGGGRNKLLEELDGKPLILHTAAACSRAGLSPVIVTRSEVIRRLAEENGYDCVIHADPEKSATIRHGLEHLLQETDIRPGASFSGCLFIPGDQPLVRPESIRRMISAFYADAGEKATLNCKEKDDPEAFDSTRKHGIDEWKAPGPEYGSGSAPVVRLSWMGISKSPVLFPRHLFPALMSLKGDQGGSAVLKGLPVQPECKDESETAERILLVEAGEEQELWDADTPIALEKIREAYGRQR